MRDEKRKRESDVRGKSERGLEVVSGRGGIHLYILDAVYISLSLAYLSTNVFSFDFPSSAGPTPPFSARARTQRVSALRAIYFFPIRPPGLSKRRADDHGRPGLLF